MENGQKKNTGRSPLNVLRGRSGSSVPSSPLSLNVEAADYFDNGRREQPGGIGGSEKSPEDLAPLPSPSLGYGSRSAGFGSPAIRPQQSMKGASSGVTGDGRPAAEGRNDAQHATPNGLGLTISSPRTSHASISASNGRTSLRPKEYPDLKDGQHVKHPTTSPQQVRAQSSHAVKSPHTLPSLDTTDKQEGTRSKGVLSGLSRKSSTFLKRARGPSRSDGELAKASPSPKVNLTPVIPSSPLASMTLSPMSPSGRPGSASSSPSMAPLPKAASIANLSMISESTSTPSSPRIGGKTPGGLIGSPKPKKKMDELMSAYLSLEKDHERFHSKKVVLKANIVRDCVIPFLRTWVSHPLNTSVTAEDLELRAIILGKWWSTLLDMLKELHNDRISGHDRPIVLEAITSIMDRPEWKLALRRSTPGLDKPTIIDQARRKSSVSGQSSIRSSISNSSTPGRLIGDNVRNIFVQTLLEQVSLVVEKMSQRTTPASLVSFCGKACAYAFTFCPGIADILVRLWGIHPSRLKRVLKVFDIDNPFRFQAEAESMIACFPPSLDSLSFVSLKDAISKLRQATNIPEVVKQVDWRGYWLKRWSGKDSDLFYAFVKQYHILLSDFVPPNAMKNEWICAPGVLPVYAQILANLDMTIHRHSGGRTHSPTKADDSKSEPAAITFDDVLGADASAVAFAPASINASRMIADNRLVNLLQDLLPLRPPPYLPASYLFAEGFCEILKASAAHTSVYDHPACFTLCDFLQESIVILAKFGSNASLATLVEWEFWMDVFTRMARSENTLTQIRVYTLIFTIWPLIAANARWKEHICTTVLLEPAYFETRFSHYCPLVRTYYQRLLCWRVARCDEASEKDILILRMLHDRLTQTDRNFRALQLETQRQGKLLLDTEPSTPAPSRRLLIIRTDVQPSPTALALEGLVPHAQMPMDLPPPAMSSDDGGLDAAQLIEKLNMNENKRGSLFRSLLGSRSPKVSGSPKIGSRESSTPGSREASPQASPAMSPRNSINQQRPGTPGRIANSGSLRTSQEQQTTGKPGFKEAYFKFSLEQVDKHRGGMPNDFHRHPPRLPHQYQALLDERSISQSAEAVDTTSSRKQAQRSSRYAGMALAEWHLVVNEYQNFFERRKREGVPNNKLVETPTLGVESLKRPG